MKVSLILEAIDRWSAPLNKATKAAHAMSQQGLRPLEQSMTRMTGASDRARGALNRFWGDTAKGERIGMRVGMAMRSLAAGGFGAVRRSALAAASATATLFASISKIALSAAAFGAAGLMAGAVAGFGFLTRGVITTGSQFEQMQAQLETSLGSVDKAKSAVTWIKKFAKDTPYDLAQVTEAFVSAKNQGMDPFNGSMTALGDGASAMGRDFKDAIDAVGDAMKKENERLRGFGIMASVKGATTTYSYLTKEGEKAKKTVQNDALAIRDALVSIFGEKFGGGMDRQSKTLHGIWENLKDVVTLFQLRIADAGFFDHVKKSLAAVYEWSQKIENQAKLDEWAKEVSDWLSTLWDKAEKFITKTDWRLVAQGVGTIITAVVSLVGWLGTATQLLARLRNRDNRRGLEGMLADHGFLGTGVGGVADNQKSWARYRLTEMDREEGRLENPRTQDRFGVPGIYSGYRAPIKKWNAPALPAPKAGNAKISLHITTDRGVSATPTNMKANGVDVEVNTGPAMAGPG